MSPMRVLSWFSAPCSEPHRTKSRLVKYTSLVPTASYVAPAPATYGAPAPVAEYIEPALAVIATLASVVEYIAPAPPVCHAAPAPAVYAAPAPVVKYISRAPAVSYTAPAPVQYAAPVTFAAAPTMTVSGGRSEQGWHPRRGSISPNWSTEHQCSTTHKCRYSAL